MTNRRDDFNIEPEAIYKYLDKLIGMVFKILPLREEGSDSLHTYIESLKDELIGFSGILIHFNKSPEFLSLLSILQFLSDSPNEPVHVYKREVFKAISICNKLKGAYTAPHKEA